MGKKDNKNKLKGLSNEAISMNQFLKRILGIHDENILKARLTHNELRSLFPDLKRTSFDHILDDPSAVYNGDIVLVFDGQNRLIPYLVSEKRKDLEELGIYDVMDEEWNQDTSTWTVEKEETYNITDYDLKSMSVYELEQLMHVYSATKQVGNYQKVRRELISREDSRRSNIESIVKAKKKEYKRQKFNY